MAMVTGSELRSRRALLAGSIGALAALAAQAIGRADIASAANGDPVLVGKDNLQTEYQWTTIARSDQDTRVAFATPTDGLVGTTFVNNGSGVVGVVGSGQGSVGVAALTRGHHSQVAVEADCREGNGEGIAVRARTKNGIGVYASAPGGYAIQAVGRTVFSRSGKVTFSKGQATRTVTGNSLTADSLIVATIQGDVSGTWVRGVSINTSTGKFTIRLNKAAPKQLKVGWFIVN